MSYIKCFDDFQNYLRVQPDNITSVNLTMEVTQFLAAFYTHVEGDNIDLMSKIFSSLNELSVVGYESVDL